MRKTLIILGILLTVTIAGFYYYTSRLKYLPDWHQEDAATEQPAIAGTDTFEAVGQDKAVDAPVPSPNRAATPSRIIRDLKAGNGFQIDEATLSAMLRKAIHGQIPPDSIDYVERLRSQITPEQITVESVVALRHLPEQKLPGQLRTIMPMLVQMGSGDNAALYLKVSGKPYVEDGTLQLDDGATLTVGRIVYALQDLLSLPIISQQAWRQKSLTKIPYRSLQLGNGVITLIP